MRVFNMLLTVVVSLLLFVGLFEGGLRLLGKGPAARLLEFDDQLGWRKRANANVHKKTGEYVFYDCSAESPKGRRSVCYDREALEARKEHKPKNSATDMAAAMGIEMLTEAQYRELQTLGDFDTKTSSWVKTPPDIRERGGAIFCDRRYDHVFTYHNGAESYYAARAFRAALKV